MSQHTKILLIAAALCFATQRESSACFCDCYYSSECSSGKYCSYFSCIVSGKKDGTCTSSKGKFSGDDLILAAQALDSWLRAYEVAGSNPGGTVGGGGPPDAALVSQAQAVPLNPEQHAIIRQLAISIQGAYLGRTSFPDPLPHRLGFFNPPAVAIGSSCSAPFLPFDNGSVLFLNSSLLGVGALVRSAVVEELRNPGQGIFNQTMSRIPVEFPDYKTFGRCEFPHPPEHGHIFPYSDGLSCLTGELGRAIEALQSEPVPTVSDWGLVMIGLLLLIGSTIVLGFRRPALVGMSGAPFAFAPPLPLFAAALFARCLGIAVALLMVILALLVWREGSVGATDLIGSSITTAGVAYLIHLWLLLRRGGPKASGTSSGDDLL